MDGAIEIGSDRRERGDRLGREGRALVARAVRQQLRLPTQAPRDLTAALLVEAARIAADNKLLGELAAALAVWGVVPPVEVMRAISAYRARAQHKARQVLPTLHLLTDTLSPAGIEWLAYKGHALQLQLGSPPDRRTTGDLDVLVRRADFARALAALQQAGMTLVDETQAPWWQRWLGEMTLLMPQRRGVPVDLHYQVQQPGCPQPSDTGRLLDNRSTIAIDGLEVPTLSPVDAALHGAICIVKAIARHESAGSHVFDFARMVLGGDPRFAAALDAEAAQQQLGRTVNVARNAAGRLLSIPQIYQDCTPVAKADWQSVLLTPERGDHTRIRGRALLWALSEGNPVVRAGRFVRDSVVVIAAERSRRKGELALQA